MSKGQKTRERIVASAAPLFNQRGVEGTSLADLMEAAGLEKGGIYRHFSSKEEVALEAFDYAWRLAMDSRIRDLDSDANSVDKLSRFVRNFVEHRSPVPGGCPLLNSAIDADDGNAALRKRAELALEQWSDLLATIVRAGIEKGEIRKQIDAKDLAALIISSLEGGLMMARLTREQKPLRSVQRHLQDYFEGSVRLAKSKS